MIGQLRYNEDSRRIELDDHEYHAGENLTVLVIKDGKPAWVETSIEYSHDSQEWYLVGLWGYQVSGLFAKI